MKKLGLLLLAMMISLSSCGGDNAKKAKESADQAVEATKDAASEAGDAVKEAAEKTADVAEEAAEKTADAANEVVDTAKEAVDTAKEAVSGVDGKTVFMNNGCIACHQVDKKTVGPSLKTIAASYVDKKDDMVKFLKGEGKAIVDPAQFAVMQPNLNTTKNMNDADLSALVDYMLSVK